ncbi:MAG: GDP-mannose mannosyl hydrolase [Sulfuricurvum sp.]|nr:GDP-mannose mannosyl hydrolase [Sulfuricurvum sp.]
MSYLDSNTFATVVENTPLISIDLIIRNSKNEVLLGRRLNAPAKGFWFTPGGRIYKNETMAEAFTRIIHDETGLTRTITDATFIGPFEHFYDDSLMSPSIATHYVVLAYEIHADIDLSALPHSQHGEYRWTSALDLMNDDTVHAHVKWYFNTQSKTIKTTHHRDIV